MSRTFDDTTMLMDFDETTSPSQLDDALSQTFAETFALKPTASKSSPIRGHSMKELDEKMAQLKKENFNLKLRIYFLEERMSQINELKDKEEAIKNNVELQVENESMRKELAEKQELLCQAAKALDLLEEKSKDENLCHIKEKSAMEVRIQELEQELQDYASSMQHMKTSGMTLSGMTQSTDSQFSSSCFEIDQLAFQVQDLQDQLKDEREKSSAMEKDVASLKQQCDSLNATVSSQQNTLLKIEGLVGVKQADFLNRIKKLIDSEKLVVDLQTQLKTLEETVLKGETKYSKLKADRANLLAKYNTATNELQRAHEEMKKLKRQRQEDLNRKPSACSLCASNHSALIDEKQKVLELEGKIQKLQEKMTNGEEKDKRNALILRQLGMDISKLTTENKHKDVMINSLKEQLSAVELKHFTTENEHHDKFNLDWECRLQSVLASLKEKESQLVACEQRLEARDNCIEELKSEITSLKREAQHLCDKCSASQANLSAAQGLCNDSSHLELMKELARKDTEIESLNSELRKRTFNLQELVNKELWDKNKQIERLELRLAAQGAVNDRQELDLKDAKQKLSEFDDETESRADDVTKLQKQLKLSMEEQKYLSREVISLRERLRNTPERDSESMKLQRLIEENRKLQDEGIRNRHWRREASQGLAVLRTRLEELAIFLDELLHQPALVVGLCADRQRVLRAAINGSLELSRTIANLSSNSLNETSVPLELCNEDSGNNSASCRFPIEDVECEDHNLGSCDYKYPSDGKPESHKLSKKALCENQVGGICNNTGIVKQEKENPVIDVLCSDFNDLCEISDCQLDEEVDEINKKDFKSPSLVEIDSKVLKICKTRRRSKSHPQEECSFKERAVKPQTGSQSQSDSEAWSEPDRSVSQARMGIQNDSSRTLSSAASTVRRISVPARSGNSSSSSSDSQTHRKVTVRKGSGNTDEGQRLTARTHCLEKLNRALETELQYRSQSSLPSSEKLSCAAFPVSESVHHFGENSTKEERGEHRDTRETKPINMNAAVGELPLNMEAIEAKHQLRTLEEKIQELNVQVLEVEIRREQAEQDAERATQEKEKLRRDLEGRLFIAEKELEQARQEACCLQVVIKELSSKRGDLEKEVEDWKDRAQHLEKELEKCKSMTQKYETEVKEIQSQLTNKFREKLHALEQLRDAAELKAKDWQVKFNDAESKCIDIDRRAKETVRLMEEHMKLKQAEVERRSEELQEKLKREAEIRASRKLEKIVEERMREYDMDSRVAYEKRFREAETIFLSRLHDLEKKAAEAAADSRQHSKELEEKIRVQENRLKEKLAEAERYNLVDGGLRNQLNEAAVAASQAQLETARLANEKLQLEQQVRLLQAEAFRERKQLRDQLTHKILSLTQANMELQKQVEKLDKEVYSNHHTRPKGSGSHSSSCGSGSPDGKVLTEITNLRRHCSTEVMSDYVSEEQEQEEQIYPLQNGLFNNWYGELPVSPNPALSTAEVNKVPSANVPQRISTASPDLGIESDQGRFSSLEPHPLKKSTTAPSLNSVCGFPSKRRHELDYKGLEQENQELKQRLQHTRQTLEQTYAQLAAANQRKRLVEKAICKQLHKTHHILRRARDNFESNPVPPTPTEETLE